MHFFPPPLLSFPVRPCLSPPSHILWLQGRGPQVPQSYQMALEQVAFHVMHDAQCTEIIEWSAPLHDRLEIRKEAPPPEYLGVAPYAYLG